jgi:hypothetical protein
MRKARKIRQKLGASMNLLEPIWQKPKGMHWRTFERLRYKAVKAEEISWIETESRLHGMEEYIPDFKNFNMAIA